MNMIPWLIAVSVAFAVLGIGWILYGYFLKAQRTLSRRRQLSRIEVMLGDTSASTEADSAFEDLPVFERFALFVSGRMQDVGAGDRNSEERLLLIRAGFRSMRALLAFNILRLLLPLLGGGLYVLYALFSGGQEILARFLMIAIALYLAPKFILSYLARERCLRLSEELPAFVDFLRMMHGVGISFEQSMTLFAQERRIGLPVLAMEMTGVNLAIRSGRSRSEALLQLAQQLDIAEFSELVALICQTDRYGSGVAEPLRQFSLRLVEKKRFEMQEYVGKMATKMVVVMLIFLLPALMIVTAGPGFIAVIKALGKMT